MENKYCVVRGDRSGVFAGTIVEQNGREIKLSNVRRIWYWSGAASISQLAKSGVTDARNCKFTVAVEELVILDAIEIIPCTPEAQTCIMGVAEWKK